MIIRITDNGADAVKPEPGETIRDCIFRLFDIDNIEQLEYFNPKFVTRAMDIPNVAMLTRRFPGVEKHTSNRIARFITGSPSRYPICGTAYLVAVRGNGWVSIDDSDCTNICAELNEFQNAENA